jgi:hypothetical protein
MDTHTHEDTLLLLDLESEHEHEPACEGPLHTQGTNGHNPSEPAKWLIIPQCGHEWACCDAWLRAGDQEFPRGWYYSCSFCPVRTFRTGLAIVEIY